MNSPTFSCSSIGKKFKSNSHKAKPLTSQEPNYSNQILIDEMGDSTINWEKETFDSFEKKQTLGSFKNTSKIMKFTSLFLKKKELELLGEFIWFDIKLIIDILQ